MAKNKEQGNENFPEVIVEAEYEELPIDDGEGRKKSSVSEEFFGICILILFLGFMFLLVLGAYKGLEGLQEAKEERAVIQQAESEQRQLISDTESETRYEVVATYLEDDVENIIVEKDGGFYNVYYNGDVYKANIDYEENGQAILRNIAKAPLNEVADDR